jgi:hypothetical protein
VASLSEPQPATSSPVFVAGHCFGLRETIDDEGWIIRHGDLQER